jgi:cell division protein FtsI (penicillin-binding protein 3)
MKTSEKRYIHLRMIAVGLIFSALFAVIGGKAAYIQIFKGPWLSQKAAGEYEKSLVSFGKRGTIYDANHREMAVTIDATSIAAHPERLKDGKETAQALSRILKIDTKTVLETLSSDRSFVWIKRQIAPKELEEVQNLRMSGIGFVAEQSRFYPHRTLAAQLLGFSGVDGHGLEGIEFYYDSYLKGETVKSTVLKDALGRGFDPAQTSIPSAYNGHSLILTLDLTIQFIAEKALAEAVVQHAGKSGIALVMNPKTGAVLALAHYPALNPNAYREFDRELRRNRAITDPFEPGSTMKIFTAAAALESGRCTPGTRFFCENGAYRVGQFTIHDTQPYGSLTLSEVIKFSSNIGAAKMGEAIGSEYFHKILTDFGFGQKTGIDCPGETSGNLPPLKRWTRIDASAISFGQGLSASPVQLLAAASAIANGGVLLKPYIVQAITDPNGRLVKSFGPREVRRVISAKTAAAVKEIMETVTVKGGTGVNAAVPGYAVCGKTGTAQKVDDTGRYARGKYVASFLGFIPAENPEAAILVLVDEPMKAHYGGIVAAPAFRKIAHETMSYLNVAPKRDVIRLTGFSAGEARG